MLEKHITPFLTRLAEQGYDRPTVMMCREVVGEFASYIDGRVTRPEDISPEHLRAYLAVRARRFSRLRRRPMRPRYREKVTHGLSLFSRYLATQGVRTGIPFFGRQDLRAVPGFEDLLAEYEQFLVRHRGLQPRTVLGYLDHAARLCKARGDARHHRWEDLTARELYEHLRTQARTLSHPSLRIAQTALRSFFRFLRTTGKCQKELDLYLVQYHVYPLSRVPRTVSAEDLRKLFEGVRGDHPSQIRDRAALLLLTVYGLRIGEVVRLRLEDVQWRHQKLVIRRRKAGRDLVLPLLPVVARALCEYVERVRPRGTVHREVFLARHLPHPYTQGASLGAVLGIRWRKLGLRVHPHALRHTLATHLINNNCPPEWIQVLLGHASFVSTQCYAKVDMTHLREVADNDAGGLL